jgi:hypothetical protein
MHGGGLMAARQALGQYLVYARPWQRALIAAGVIAGGALLLGAGIAAGHVVMAVIGGLVLLAAGNACVRVLRGRRVRWLRAGGRGRRPRGRDRRRGRRRWGRRGARPAGEAVPVAGLTAPQGRRTG